jgi:hypothetical protein
MNPIGLNAILEMLPLSVSLCDIGRNDDLSNYMDTLQECVADNSLDKLSEALNDTIWECERESFRYYMRELQNEIAVTYSLAEEAAYGFVFETYAEEIKGMLYERDGSDFVGGLLRNTNKVSLFIDTGLTIGDYSYRWTRSEQTEWLKKIKRTLKITSAKWDDAIRSMLDDASYGGQLVVYFYDAAGKLFCEGGKDWKSVTFIHPTIAIINTGNGSGGDTHLNGHQVTLPFSRTNLFIDKSFKYNYVTEVCGMRQDWCKKTEVRFSFEPVAQRKRRVSPLAAQALRDREYVEKYKKGSCTHGDMDITRHRDVHYVNQFPCGNKCPHCNTFWID